MKRIFKVETILYSIVLIGIIVGTFDFFNRFSIRTWIALSICGGVEGHCYLDVINIFGVFHYLGSFMYLALGQNKVFFIVGQLITLLLYCAIIWVVLFFVKILLNKYLKHK
ncbi:MAG: hypothetical protein N4A72_20215 [Bacteroidales bacterium]|jgi:membrane-bound metal-dependent hydrolase YbcI (DUF457 family)|nr:hypothetical protein [Bacteroidales bacterium]